MVAWGIVMTLMCLCNTFRGLIAARFFLGLTESGLFPGVTFYLSLWYRRQDVALRIAVFFSAATIAGAFGGILAFGIEHMEGVGGLHGWQWIFCLEGLLTIIIATLAYFFMHDYPETATFLAPHEKQIIVQMLKEDSQGLATHYDMKFVWQALSDFRAWAQALLYLCLLVPIYAIALFLPTIIHSLGYSAADAQLLTIPPFVAGCIITISVGYFSDKYNFRGPFIIGGCIISLVGFIVLITETRPGAGYAGSFIAAIGVFPTIAISLAWAGSAAGGDVRKGVTFAIVIGLGNLGGICSSFIYLKPPRFFVGHGVCIGLLALAIFVTLFIMWDFRRANKEREAYCAANGLDESRRDEFVELGSDSPLFRFTL